MTVVMGSSTSVLIRIRMPAQWEQFAFCKQLSFGIPYVAPCWHNLSQAEGCSNWDTRSAAPTERAGETNIARYVNLCFLPIQGGTRTEEGQF